MPYRNIVFAENETYHIYNRSVAKIPIFLNNTDYKRFLDLISYYRSNEPPLRYSFFKRLEREQKENITKEMNQKNSFLIEIISFCLMPNHFHLLIKQLNKNGIINFMRIVQNGYARYFNTKYNRCGSLFQSSFKGKRVESTEQLLHVSRYIHLNPFSSYLVKIEELANYPWSSFNKNKEYASFVKDHSIIENFKSYKDYQDFVFDQAEYQQILEDIKHITID